MDSERSTSAQQKVKEKPSFPNNYQELKGENQVVEGGRKWSTERLLAEYVQCTDGLIGKMDGTIPLKGVEVYRYIDGKIVKEKKDLPPPDSVIYLDKSARPVEWMVRKLWPQLARTPGTTYDENSVPKKPRDFFLNIDKGDWLRKMGVPPHLIERAPNEMIDVNRIDKEHLARIRALFTTVKIDENNIEDAWNHPTIFEGQHVMIVDEVKSSGRTLDIAQMLMAAAIPEVTFSGQYWAKPARIILNNGIEVDGEKQYKIEWVPVWYREGNAMGRAISDRDPEWPEKAEEKGYHVSWQSKIGRSVLSTPTHHPDTYDRKVDMTSLTIREDINQMSKDLYEGRIFYRPSLDRPQREDSDWSLYQDRLESINHMNFATWKTKVKEVFG